MCSCDLRFSEETVETMPEPYPSSPNTAASGRFQFELIEILLLVAVGGGIVGYLIGFFNEAVRVNIGSLSGAALIVAAALSAIRLLPKFGGASGPNTLYAAAPLAIYAVLALLQSVVGGTGGLTIVLLVLALVQAAALVWALLAETGMVDGGGNSRSPQQGPAQSAPPPPFGPPGQFQQGGGWNPPNKPVPGHFGQGGQFGQPGAPAQPQPQPGGWNPNSGGQPTANPSTPNPTVQPPGQPQQGTQSGYPQQGQPQGQPQQAQPGQQGPSQQGPAQQGQSGGPLGTQQMPHPGN